MIPGVGPYSALFTPKAGSLFHAVFQPSELEAPFGWDQHSPTCFFEALDQGLALSFEFLKTRARGDQCSLAKAISKICEFASQAGVILDRDFDT